jgi:TatA/E family protein of Tat protein translocase
MSGGPGGPSKTGPSDKLADVFNVGPEKLILLFIIALMVLGPSKLPDAARTLGKAIAEFRRISGSLQSEVREVLSDPKDAFTAAVADVRKELGNVGNDVGQVRQGLSDGIGIGGAVGAGPTSPGPIAQSSSAAPLVPPSPDDPSLN